MAIAEIKGDRSRDFLALFVKAACLSLLELLLPLLGDFLSSIGDLTLKNPPSKVLSASVVHFWTSFMSEHSELNDGDGNETSTETVDGSEADLTAFLLAAF